MACRIAIIGYFSAKTTPPTRSKDTRPIHRGKSFLGQWWNFYWWENMSFQCKDLPPPSSTPLAKIIHLQMLGKNLVRVVNTCTEWKTNVIKISFNIIGTICSCHVYRRYHTAPTGRLLVEFGRGCAAVDVLTHIDLWCGLKLSYIH